jgi:hypothetical protein
MIAAGVAAPELAPALLDAEGGFMGLEGTAALTGAGAVSGAGLSGLAAGVTGQDIGRSALLGGVGGGISGYMQGTNALVQAGADPNIANQAAMKATNTLSDLAPGETNLQALTPKDIANQIQQGAIPAADAAKYTQTYNSAIKDLAPVVQPFSATTGQMFAAAAPATLGILGQKPAGAYTPPNAIYKGGPLQKFHYDPSTYQPDVVTQPNPPYKANYSGMAGSSYAEGGITRFDTGGVSGSMDGHIYRPSYESYGIDSLPAAQQNDASYSYNSIPTPTRAPIMDSSNSYNPMLIPHNPAWQAEKDRIAAEEAASAAATQNPFMFRNNFNISDGSSTGAGGGKAGGLMPTDLSYASGGISNLGSYSDGGRLLKGPGDGMSDNIPAKIGGHQEARLADGEFVVPADVVSHLGNGSTDAGAKHLYKMMDKVRKARTGNPKQGKQIKASKYLPA